MEKLGNTSYEKVAIMHGWILISPCLAHVLRTVTSLLVNGIQEKLQVELGLSYCVEERNNYIHQMEYNIFGLFMKCDGI